MKLWIKRGFLKIRVDNMKKEVKYKVMKINEIFLMLLILGLTIIGIFYFLHLNNIKSAQLPMVLVALTFMAVMMMREVIVKLTFTNSQLQINEERISTNKTKEYSLPYESIQNYNIFLMNCFKLKIGKVIRIKGEKNHAYVLAGTSPHNKSYIESDFKEIQKNFDLISKKYQINKKTSLVDRGMLFLGYLPVIAGIIAIVSIVSAFIYLLFIK